VKGLRVREHVDSLFTSQEPRGLSLFLAFKVLFAFYRDTVLYRNKALG